MNALLFVNCSNYMHLWFVLFNVVCHCSIKAIMIMIQWSHLRYKNTYDFASTTFRRWVYHSPACYLHHHYQRQHPREPGDVLPWANSSADALQTVAKRRTMTFRRHASDKTTTRTYWYAVLANERADCPSAARPPARQTVSDGRRRRRPPRGGNRLFGGSGGAE